MIENERILDSRQNYSNFCSRVIVSALEENDRNFFKDKNSPCFIYLDLLNSVKEYNLSREFFLNVLDNNCRGKSDLDLLLLLYQFGFKGDKMCRKLWRIWHNKSLNIRNLTKTLQEKFQIKGLIEGVLK